MQSPSVLTYRTAHRAARRITGVPRYLELVLGIVVWSMSVAWGAWGAWGVSVAHADSSSASIVPVIEINEEVELGLAAHVQRVLHEHPDAPAIIVRVNTFGGRIDAAVQIRDALIAAKTRTIAFIDPRAISAGALISLACDNILIAPGGSIGAATPVEMSGTETTAADEKAVSYFRAEMRATAELNHRRGDIAEAMVDPDVAIPNVIEAGKLLTLDSAQALTLGIADASATNLREVLDFIAGSENHNLRTEAVEPNWGESIARVLTGPVISGLLMTIGMLGIMVTFYTRHAGVVTFVGAVSLVLFFGGHSIVNLVGWEEAIAVAAALVLLAAEIFVIPGFGLAGVLGIGLLFAAFIAGMTGLPIDVSWNFGLVQTATVRLVYSALLAVVALFALFKLLPYTPAGKRLVLEHTAKEFFANDQIDPMLNGALAVALTDLRPIGKVTIGAVRYEATCERGFVPRGGEVRVIAVAGSTLIVRPEEIS